MLPKSKSQILLALLVFTALLAVWTEFFHASSYAAISRIEDGAIYEFTGGSRTSFFQGHGFDACHFPSIETLQVWWQNSPYRIVTLYGGPAWGCLSDGETSPNVIQQASQQGWKFIPTWVGLQSNCRGGSVSNDPSVAYNQGVAQAELAINWASRLGLTDASGGGTVIYYDLESYNGSNLTACRAAAQSLIKGWITRLHDANTLAGVYGSSCSSYLADFASIIPMPDTIWPAGGGFYSSQYSSSAHVWDIPCVPNNLWNSHQRIYQYSAGHSETWGGVSHHIDSDIIEGIVADLSVQSGDWAYQIFAQGDFNGEKLESNQSYSDLSTIGKNDWAQSMRVNAGYEVLACSENNLQGVCGRTSGYREMSDINQLVEGIRGQLSSIKVCANACPTSTPSPSPIPLSTPTVTQTPFVRLGDINGDGSTNRSDLTLLIRMIHHSPQPDTMLYAISYWQQGNLNQDNSWNVVDLQKLIGLTQQQ